MPGTEEEKVKIWKKELDNFCRIRYKNRNLRKFRYEKTSLRQIVIYTDYALGLVGPLDFAHSARCLRRFCQDIRELKGHGRIEPMAFLYRGHGEMFIMALIFGVSFLKISEPTTTPWGGLLGHLT